MSNGLSHDDLLSNAYRRYRDNYERAFGLEGVDLPGLFASESRRVAEAVERGEQ